MEYKIVMVGSGYLEVNEEILEGVKLLEYLVNESIKDSWEPAGGVSCDGGVFYQAMTRKVEVIA